MTDEEAKSAGLERLVGNLETFTAHCLKIKDKNGQIQPFIWNKAQRHARRVAAMRRLMDKVMSGPSRVGAGGLPACLSNHRIEIPSQPG